jgi:hypothetical protein
VGMASRRVIFQFLLFLGHFRPPFDCQIVASA